MKFSCKKFVDSEKLPTFASGKHKKTEKNKGSGQRSGFFFFSCFAQVTVLMPKSSAHCHYK